MRSSGHGFIGIGRKRLLEILGQRARELGVELHYERECEPGLEHWADWDLVIGADGINSRFRDHYAEHFGVDSETRANRFIWLGTPKAFDAFTFAFEKTEAGWIWAHAYRFARRLLDLHRRMLGRDLARARLRHAEPGGINRGVRADLRQISRRHSR